MYRLFNLIEKQDGKVIGNVLSSGKELTLKNMLEASRSNRHMNSEYVIDDDFGLLEQVVEKGESITSQLERTFMQMMDPVPDKSYIDEKIKDIRTASKIKDPEEILSVLEQPVTVENILAVSAMSEGMGKGFKKMFSRETREGMITAEKFLPKRMQENLRMSFPTGTVHRQPMRDFSIRPQ